MSITAPAAGATVSGTATVSADAADNVGVAGVQFAVDGVNLGTEITAPPYTVPWMTQGSTDLVFGVVVPSPVLVAVPSSGLVVAIPAYS